MTTGSPGALRRDVALVPIGVALDLTLGTIVHALKLPVYIDSVGTIIVTILAGLRAGVLTGVITVLIAGALTDPILPWFCGTKAAIALYTHIAARRGWFRTYQRTVLTGIGLGIVAGAVSAPVVAILFGGVTGSGAALVVALLLKSGYGLYKAVLLSGLASEPLDKTIQCLLAVWLLRGMPASVLGRFRSGSLETNGFGRG